MPDDTVIDGEVVALDAEGQAVLQPSAELRLGRSAAAFLHLRRAGPEGQDVMGEPLTKRRELLEKHVLPKLAEPIRYSPCSKAA